jgi:hypothetical protein
MAQFRQRSIVRQLILACPVVALLVPPANGVELRSETAAAFDRYIRATETRMAADLNGDHFLIVDGLPEARRKQAYTQLRQGQLYIEQLHTKADGRPVHVPGGLIHHWVGLGFIPGGTLSRTLAVLQDYDNHKTTYKPDVRESKLLEHNGNEFKVYLQLYRKSLVTVVVDATLDAEYTAVGYTKAMSKSYSTRIAEVADVGKPDERELPVGNDHGYIWRLYTYWRIEEKDDGVYIQVESVGLSRTVPWEIAWLVAPFIRSVPKGVLSDLLERTRNAVKSTSQSHAPRNTELIQPRNCGRQGKYCKIMQIG